MADQVPSSVADPRRLEALAGYGVLDTGEDPVFDEIVALAAGICAAPVGLISFVAEDRQWFKAHVGTPLRETPIGDSICAHALVEPDLLVIGDLARDPRTAGNPLVCGPPHARFYAGAPLRAPSGEVLGSLCVVDTEPRPQGLTEIQAQTLRVLGRQVMNLLELTRALRERNEFLRLSRSGELRRVLLQEVDERMREHDSVAQMTRAVCAVVAKGIAADRAAFGRLDPTGEFIDIEPDWLAPGMNSIAGRHRFADYGDIGGDLSQGRPLVIHDVRQDPRTEADPSALLQLDIGALVNMPVMQHGRTTAVLIVQSRHARHWSEEDLHLLRRVADRVEVGAGRLQAQDNQRTLNRELSHRMKNSLAMVQAIATQTMRHSQDQAAVGIFNRRVHALATAHDILLQRQWSASRLGEVIRRVLEHFGQPDRIVIEGPENIMLGPQATTNLSLIAHELGTNALKYGALAGEAGRVSVRWSVDEEADLHLAWTEQDGAIVSAPSRRGFGTRLIAMGLLGKGGVQLSYPPAGFTAILRAPIAQLHAY